MNAIDDIRIRAGVSYVSDTEAVAVLVAAHRCAGSPDSVDVAYLLRHCDRCVPGGVAQLLTDVRNTREETS